MSNSITKFSVQNHMKGEDEKSYLHRPLFNVNMRLYKSSKRYKMLISDIIAYMRSSFGKKFSDYEKIKGISGANLGIPFNIIVVADGKKLLAMINPKIVRKSRKMKRVKSNCGSLRLEKPIEVLRYWRIVVSFFDEKGKKIESTFGGSTDDTVGSTIQHEIDHNKGITIEDRHKQIKNVDMGLIIN